MVKRQLNGDPKNVTSMEEVRLIVAEYLHSYLLRKYGFNWNYSKDVHRVNGNEANILSTSRRTKVVDKLYLVSFELLEEYMNDFECMSEKFNFILEQSLTLHYEVFENIWNELFYGEIRWIHVVMFLLFGAELSYTHGVRDSRYTTVDEIYEHLLTYAGQHLISWINDHGGWEGFVTHANSNMRFNREIQDLTDKAGESSPHWITSNFFKISAAVGAVGIAAALIGMFVSCKH